MIRRLAFALGLSAILAAPAAAQIPLLDVRVGAHALMPTGDLADTYKAGFGAYARLGIPTGMFKIMGTLTFNQLPGKTVEVLGTPLEFEDETILGLTVGPHLALPMTDVGLELGYFSNFEKLGFVPSVSLGFGNFDIMASYSIVNSEPSKANWFSLGIGFRF